MRKFLYKSWVTLASFGIFLICALVVLWAGSTTPDGFVPGHIVRIPKNSGLIGAAQVLSDNHVIRSPLIFEFYALVLGGHKRVQAGDYLFAEPQSALYVAWRTIHGQIDLPKIAVTIPDGSNSSDIADILKRRIPEFDSDAFLRLAKPLEGKLFPDTYFFYQDLTPELAIKTFTDTFAVKTDGLRVAMHKFGRTESDILIMASIVEREASDPIDRRIIAGILWKRLDKGMPLQVDPPFYYLLGKTSAELTMKDLTMDSPYNLYKNKGLPPTPIANPSLDSIQATINPQQNKYWYFLSDIHGVTHYAATWEEHLANKKKYL